MKLEDLIDTIGAGDIKSFASEKKGELTQGLKNIMSNVKKLDVNLTDNLVLETIKDNVNEALDRVQDLEVLEFAKDKVSSTKNQVLSVLNVPSQVEMDNLTRKIVSLEKKLKTISKQKSK